MNSFYNLKIIYANDQNGLIGFNTENGSKMPWSGQHADLQFLKTMIRGNNVVIGRKTYESIPKSFLNEVSNTYVISRARFTPQDIVKGAEKRFNETFIVLGGKSLYDYFYQYASFIYETRFNFTSEIPENVEPIYMNKYSDIKRTIPIRINNLNGLVYLHCRI